MSKLSKKTKKQEERKQLSKGVYASLHSLSQDNDPEQHDAADCVEEVIYRLNFFSPFHILILYILLF